MYTQPPPPTPTYTISAHGNISYGVNRTGLSSFNYSIGNCAHCHEQHTRIGGVEPAPNSPVGPDYYLLFKDLWVAPVQSNLFCYGCHIEVGSYQSGGNIINYCYSRTRGGDTTLTCPDSVYESFQFVNDGTVGGTSKLNCGSTFGTSHLIYNIGAFMLNRWGFSGTGVYINPCDVCHNPHRAKRAYPCSRPSAHANLTTWNVWGDDAGTSERMDVASTNLYWAPKRLGGGYEPDGSATQDGSNMPNYVFLCYDCHSPNTAITSSRLGNLRQINWSATGDFHGGRARIDGPGDFSGVTEYGDLLAPYKVGAVYQKTNYVLSCTDCHEPHGSPNEYLLRATVNGTQVNVANGGPISNGRWYYFCLACHSLSGHAMNPGPSTDCYMGGGCHKHCGINSNPCAANSMF